MEFDEWNSTDRRISAKARICEFVVHAMWTVNRGMVAGEPKTKAVASVQRVPSINRYVATPCLRVAWTENRCRRHFPMRRSHDLRSRSDLPAAARGHDVPCYRIRRPRGGQSDQSGLRLRLQRLRTEALPVLSWGTASWHVSEDRLSVVQSTVLRMTRICMGLVRPENDDSVTWRKRSYAPSRAALAESCGAMLAMFVGRLR